MRRQTRTLGFTASWKTGSLTVSLFGVMKAASVGFSQAVQKALGLWVGLTKMRWTLRATMVYLILAERTVG
jgi:hypothetical protein